MKETHTAPFETRYFYAFLPLFLAILVFDQLLIVKKIFQIGINSDSLYLYCLYKDVFVDGYTIAHWILSPAPCFFPDMALFFPLLAVSPNAGYAYVAYDLVYLSLLSALLYGVSVSIHGERKMALHYILLGVVGFNAILLTPALHTLDEFMYVPARHAGIMLPGTAMLLLWLRMIKHGFDLWYAVMLFALAFLASLSDMHVVTQFIAPLVLASFAFSVMRLVSFKQSVVLSTIALMGFILGVGTLHGLTAAQIITPSVVPVETWLSLERLLSSGKTFLLSISFLCQIKPEIAVIFVLFSLHCIFILQRGLIAIREGGLVNSELPLLLFVNIFLLWMIVCSVSITVAAGIWYSFAEVRYLLPVFLFSAIAPGFALSGKMFRFSSGLRLGVSAFIVVFAILRLFPATLNLKISDVQMPYPSFVEDIDRTVTEHNLKNGYAGYWSANVFNALTKTDARVFQIHQRMVPYLWINSADAYCGRPDDRRLILFCRMACLTTKS